MEYNDEFLNKYKASHKAGGRLEFETLYNGAVHCYYYAFFQFLKHIAEKKYANESQEKGKGSHKSLINNFIDKLIEKNINKVQIWKIRVKIESLKDARIKADYEIQNISKEESKQASKESLEIIDFLKKTFL